MRILLAVPVIALAGCVHTSETGNPKIADQQTVALLKEGMAEADVKLIIGEPTSVDFTDSGQRKLIYQHFKVDVSSSPIGMQQAHVMHTLTILVSKDGKVIAVAAGIQKGGDHQPDPMPEAPATPTSANTPPPAGVRR